MNRYEDSDFSRMAEPKKKRKWWIPAAAAALALTVATTAVGLSMAAPAGTDNVMLTLAEAQGTETEKEPAAGGYILTDVSDVVDQVLPSVVSITSRSLVNYYGSYMPYGNGYEDLWDFIFGGGSRGDRRYYGYEDEEAEPMPGEDEEPVEVESGMGSGTIVAKNDSELLILTSYHVVEGSSSLYVTFNNDANVDGYIKSADAEKDIAIVAIPLEDVDQDTLDSIKVATMATEEPAVGDGVIVIGNALGYGISVTTGIVSALDREVWIDGDTMSLLQTDAAINAGNSGGCMLNSRGEVIGINEAKIKVSYVEGMCYAIPVAPNLELIQDLINAEGSFDPDAAFTQGAYLGIRGRDVTSEISLDYGMPQGVYVSSTIEGSGADEAGVQSGDIIVGLDDTAISTMEELQKALNRHEAGDVVTLVINRLSEGTYVEMTLDVTLTDRIS